MRISFINSSPNELQLICFCVPSHRSSYLVWRYIISDICFVNTVLSTGDLISEMRELHDSSLAYLKWNPLNGFVFEFRVVARRVGNISICSISKDLNRRYGPHRHK